jgi:hypothetical protein
MIPHRRDEIGAAIDEARVLYHKLVLVVGPASSGKTEVLRSAAASHEKDLVNLNNRLAEMLLEVSAKQRPLRIQEFLLGAFAESNGMIFFDNTELLFDTNLHQDPLRLLQAVSRQRTVVATWSGIATSSTLQYAEPDHPEYRSYSDPDVIIVSTLPGSTGQ